MNNKLTWKELTDFLHDNHDRKGVRLDWCMFYKKDPYRWKINHCYILEAEGNE